MTRDEMIQALDDMGDSPKSVRKIILAEYDRLTSELAAANATNAKLMEALIGFYPLLGIRHTPPSVQTRRTT